MFDNIGGKIKKLAAGVSYVGIAISCFVGLGLIITGAGIIGLLVAVIGSLLFWAGSFMTYGFGQLIENSDKLIKLFANGNVESTGTIKSEVESEKHPEGTLVDLNDECQELVGLDDEWMEETNEEWLKSQIDCLNEQLAKGEITKDEYNSMMRELKENVS